MSEEETVNWSYLPHSPEKFFECDENSTRRDLKRAYNKILKKFKPEQYPEEFKKIRKAFEELDSRLSYGFKAVAAFESLEEPAEEAEQNSVESDFDLMESHFEEDIDTLFSDPFERDNSQNEVLSELFEKNADPEEILEQLENKKSKNSSDIILTALIKESLDSRFSIFDYILDFYSQRKDSAGLKNFIYHFLRSPDFSQEIEVIIEKVARNVRGEDFFYLTENLWFRLAESKGIDFCCAKISEMESIIGYIPPNSLTVFYLHFCTRFVFSLEESFLLEKMQIIEDESADFYWHEDNAAQFLTDLFEYRQSLDSFLNGCSSRETLHKLIKLWCESDESMKQRAFINEVVSLDTNKILKIKDFSDSSMKPCAELIETICSEIREDSWEESTYDEEEKNKRIRLFMLNIEDVTDQSGLGSANSFFTLGLLVFHLAVVITPSVYAYNYFWTLWSEGLQQSLLRFLILAGIIAGVGVLYFFTLFVPVQNKFDKVSDFLARRLYNKVWRKHVIQFLKQNPITFTEFQMELIYMENTKGITNNSDMYTCVSSDCSLRIFSSIHSLPI